LGSWHSTTELRPHLSGKDLRQAARRFFTSFFTHQITVGTIAYVAARGKPPRQNGLCQNRVVQSCSPPAVRTYARLPELQELGNGRWGGFIGLGQPPPVRIPRHRLRWRETCLAA